MPTQIAEAQIAALFAQSISYGLYLITSGLTAHYLLRTVGANSRWRKPDEIRWFFVAIASALFVNASFNISLTLVRVLDAFVHYNGPPAEYFGQVSSWINVTKVRRRSGDIAFSTLIHTPDGKSSVPSLDWRHRMGTF